MLKKEKKEKKNPKNIYFGNALKKEMMTFQQICHEE